KVVYDLEYPRKLCIFLRGGHALLRRIKSIFTERIQRERALLAIPVDDQMVCDGIQQRSRVAHLLSRRKRLPIPHKGLLNKILRKFPARGLHQAETENSIAI